MTNHPSHLINKLKLQRIFIQYDKPRGFTWKEKLKAAGIIVLVNLFLSTLYIIFGIDKLLISQEAVESNSWITRPILVFVAFFTILPLFAYLEELLFRWLPYKLSAVTGHKHYWFIGILSSIAFAMVHGYNKGLPSLQFIFGLYMWYYIPSGLKNNFWIHFFYNVNLIMIVYVSSLVVGL